MSNFTPLQIDTQQVFGGDCFVSGGAAVKDSRLRKQLNEFGRSTLCYPENTAADVAVADPFSGVDPIEVEIADRLTVTEAQYDSQFDTHRKIDAGFVVENSIRRRDRNDETAAGSSFRRFLVLAAPGALTALLAVNAMWIGIGLYPRFQQRVDRYQLGAFSDGNSCSKAVREVGLRWLQDTPPVYLSDEPLSWTNA